MDVRTATKTVRPMSQFPRSITIHKRNLRSESLRVSIVLLDWSVRERFHALDWLNRQNVPRTRYEIIWVELYDRVVPEVMEKADVVITCNQKGLYHKHIGYNIGLLQARSQIITVCDSDAVFPPDFVDSILRTFHVGNSQEPAPLVLMHHEYRTHETYPPHLSDFSELKTFLWADLATNVGACMSVRNADAIRFGGFDEHSSFRGFICGPYDLGWRLINAGVTERWQDPTVALWHFWHPEVVPRDRRFSWKRWSEIRHPHIGYHALTAIEAFSSGRLLPLLENSAIHQLRLSQRCIGSACEVRFARMTKLVTRPLWHRVCRLLFRQSGRG